jgi:hypothetical protein
MEELLTHGVNFGTSDAVYFVVSEDHAEVLKLLLDDNESSMSAVACRCAFTIAPRESDAQHSCELIQWSLKVYGDKRVLDDHGQGALNCAFLAVCEGLAKWSDLMRPRDGDEVFQILKTLIEAGALITAHNDGCSPLHFVMQLNSPSKLVAFLLDHGANPNFCAPGEHSQFFQFLESPKAIEKLVNMFTDAGAVIGPRDARGRTILRCARKANIATWLYQV